MVITITYAFGNFTGVLVVEDWTAALEFLSNWTNMDSMSWIRVQRSCIAQSKEQIIASWKKEN